MPGNSEEIALIITGLAQIYDRTLDEFSIKMYLEILGGYSPELVDKAAQLCVAELGFMPRPIEITNRIDRLENEAYHRNVRKLQANRLPEPLPSEEEKAFGSFVCRVFAGWMRSGFIGKQRERGEFIDYDHSLFAYMTEQGENVKYIDRLAGAYPRDPRRE